jgi:hypothetical protein
MLKRGGGSNDTGGLFNYREGADMSARPLSYISSLGRKDGSAPAWHRSGSPDLKP